MFVGLDAGLEDSLGIIDAAREALQAQEHFSGGG